MVIHLRGMVLRGSNPLEWIRGRLGIAVSLDAKHRAPAKADMRFKLTRDCQFAPLHHAAKGIIEEVLPPYQDRTLGID